ncbi:MULTISPECIES: DUF599 domain-containing protein [Cohaesibacter]|uniref:DUF599 domain-containing protein n=1 Tax=Cohaesibacter TaxID=655352 RepID=UPI000DE8E4BC|nr:MULTISPECIES: DUF599 family protein [Cohaesibacter]TLP48827.1 DUF599 family protein [Cohaesibacter sp. CAU 1516]
MEPFTLIDLIGLGWYVAFWVGFSYLADHSPLRKRTLSSMMNAHRRRWMQTMARRKLRMVDTAIISGLQNGTAFFASTSLLAIGAGFALLNSTELALQITRDLPLPVETTRTLWEIKALILICIYVYAFFKFGWAYRLFNYTSILIGALPYHEDFEPDHVMVDEQEMVVAIEQVAEMNALAGRHFNLGLRAFFFSLALFGWFIDPLLLMAATTFVTGVLIRRQFFSRSNKMAHHLLP